ncbi:MAG: DUF2961 domain-containing protein, partial [Armatimonadota bacterium]
MDLQEAGNFANQYFGTSSGGFFCKFPMPFRQGFRIEIENIDEHLSTEVFLNALYQIGDNLPDDAAYFHAQFRRTNPLAEKEVYTILDGIKGQGHYVGTYLAW